MLSLVIWIVCIILYIDMQKEIGINKALGIKPDDFQTWMRSNRIKFGVYVALCIAILYLMFSPVQL